MMNKLLIKDLEDTFIQRLQERALEHGVSIEEEVKTLLQHVLNQDSEILDGEDKWLARAYSLQQKNAHRQKTDSTLLIRNNRETR